MAGLEREVKIRVSGPERGLRGWLAKIGAEPRGACDEVDIYFSHPCRDFSKTDEALRLRLSKCGGAPRALLTYKGPRLGGGALKVREEVEVELGAEEAERVAEVLERLGFREFARVKKRREAYSARGALVFVDSVEGLGLFVEIEGEGAEALLESASGEAWFGGAVDKTYLELLLERGRASDI